MFQIPNMLLVTFQFKLAIAATCTSRSSKAILNDINEKGRHCLDIIYEVCIEMVITGGCFCHLGQVGLMTVMESVSLLVGCGIYGCHIQFLSILD